MSEELRHQRGSLALLHVAREHGSSPLVWEFHHFHLSVAVKLSSVGKAVMGNFVYMMWRNPHPAPVVWKKAEVLKRNANLTNLPHLLGTVACALQREAPLHGELVIGCEPIARSDAENAYVHPRTNTVTEEN